MLASRKAKAKFDVLVLMQADNAKNAFDLYSFSEKILKANKQY